MATTTDNGDHAVLEATLAIQTADAVQRHLATTQEVTRLALEDTVRSNEDLKQRIITAQEQSVAVLQQSLQMLQEVLQQFSRLIVELDNRAKQPPILNVEPAEITLRPQDVHVSVPREAITVTPQVKLPAINVPEPTVVIDKKPQKLPARVTVKHSDGTQSTIEFGSPGR